MGLGVLFLSLSSIVTLGKSASLPKSRFPNLENEDDNAYLVRLL